MANAIVSGLLMGQNIDENANATNEKTETTITSETKEATGTFTPYLVTIKAKALNVRKGPGTNYDSVKLLMNDKNKYTIVDEQNGKGATKWCKLKSGLGWISKDFVTVVK